MIAVIDYGAGNLFSVSNALRFLGVEHCLTKDEMLLREASGLILPGVGAFPSAMKKLKSSGLINCILEESAKKPLLGICLGMQLLFEYGYEFEETAGLGLIPGTVEKMCPNNTDCKIPHMGWNSLHIQNSCSLLEGVAEKTFVYFVHSYAAKTQAKYIAADVDHGGSVPALVFRGNVFGAQFHPEKSGTSGLAILKNFSNLCK